MRALAIASLLLGCCAEPYPPQLPAPVYVSDPSVFVLGQVQRPGRYRLVAPTTLSQIIAAVGLTPLAWKMRVITRTAWDGRSVRARVSLDQIREGQMRDVWLFPGDIVYVGERTF